MRKLTTNAVAMLLALVGCMGCGNRSASSVDNLIRVDVMADYPEKELILQDLMDVEYIALETTDDFITKGAVKAIGKDIMLVTNRGSDGDILVFDKNGKGLRKINRLGQSGEEYTQLTGLVLDEDNDEIFVKDNPARKIGVYDLLGNYKRRHAQNHAHAKGRTASCNRQHHYKLSIPRRVVHINRRRQQYDGCHQEV